MGGAGGNATAVACQGYAQAMCSRFETCAPARTALYFGDATVCLARVLMSCESLSGAPGSNWNAADVTACASALSSNACSDFDILANTGGPAACALPPGARADGANCGSESQCQSGHCHHPGALCGSCMERGGAGATCVADADCQPGFLCVASATNPNSVCVVAGKVGDACVKGVSPCGFGLACCTAAMASAAECTEGKCVALLSKGASCEVGAGTCDTNAGVYCDGSANTCQEPTFATTSGTCGTMSSGSSVFCSAAGVCYMPSGTMGACVAPVDVGKACNLKKGPGCMLPALCLGGMCSLPADCP